MCFIIQPPQRSGCSAVRLARFVRDEEVGGSNPLTPTMIDVAFVPAVVFLCGRCEGLHLARSRRKRLSVGLGFSAAIFLGMLACLILFATRLIQGVIGARSW